MNALQKEYGGDHYHQMKVQPIELITQCNWNFIQGNIAKYVLRHKYKNGKEDLQKAIHYCEIGMELDNDKTERFVPINTAKLLVYFCINIETTTEVYFILQGVAEKDYEKLIPQITNLLNSEYPSEK